MLQGVKEDLKYVISESGFGHSWRSSCLFLCDSRQERELLAQLLCRYARLRWPHIPIVFFRITGLQSSDEAVHYIGTVLHAAAKKWLSESPFAALDLDGLAASDLRVLVAEAIKGFRQRLRWEKQPAFIVEIVDAARTGSILSTLNFLRSVISEGDIAWVVFAPEAVLDISDPSGVSPFYNIFPIRDLKTKFVTIPNPYMAGPAVRSEEHFFGRTQMMANIQQSIFSHAQPIALWGPRRIGKTSLLLRLLDPLRARCLPVHLDCQGLGVEESIDLFYMRLGLEVLGEEAQEYGETESLIRSDRGISSGELMGIIARLEQRRRCKVVYLMDEIELLLDFKDGPTALRQLADAGLVRLIVGGVELKEQLYDSTSPIFRMFTAQKLGCLERDAAIELVTRPVQDRISYDPEAIDEILWLVGTHPFLVQMLCDLIIEVLNREASTTVTAKTVRRAYQEFKTAALGMFRSLIHLLDPLCLDLLGAFAQTQSQAAQTRIGRDEFLQYVSMEGETLAGAPDLHYRVEQAIEALCDQEIIEILDNQYRLKAQCYLDHLVPGPKHAAWM